MVRSALGRVSRRLSGSFAAPSMTSLRGPEVFRTPPLPSLHPSEPWIPRARPAAQLMRTFVSPATAAAAAAARSHGVPNLQGWQHFPAISKGTRGMKWSEQKRFLSMQRKESALKRFVVWFDKSVDPRHEFIFVTFVSASCFVANMIAYHNIGSHQVKPLDPCKVGAGDLDGGDHSLEGSWGMLGVWQC